MSDSTALVLPGYEHIYSGKVRDLYAREALAYE